MPGASSNAMSSTELDHRQRVVLYPSFAFRDRETEQWRLLVRGVTFAEGRPNLRSKFLLLMLKKFLKANKADFESAIFKQRIAGFLADSRKGRAIRVRVGEKTHQLKKRSGRNGHFAAQLPLDAAQLRDLTRQGTLRDDWLDVLAEGCTDGVQATACRAHFIENTGLSIVSDIDDTIKISEVASKRTLLRNTFLKEFAPVPGMPELYRQWAERGAAFHYVSTSPWQLYGPLADFARQAGFPEGSYHLRAVRLRDPSVLRLFVARRRGKRHSIAMLLKTFPQRRFVLVGDSGEKDPEIYGWAARRFPGQVARILIRNIEDKPLLPARTQRAFRKLPADLWTGFEDAAQLRGLKIE